MARARAEARARPKRPAARGAPTVADLFATLDGFAPFRYAADWDNVGLLAGRLDWPAQRALLAIDLTDAVAREALTDEAQALVIYHPPIFKGIRNVTPAAGGPTTLLPDLLAARISILALHTALDAAVGGTNDVLLDIFAPVERRPLEPIVRENQQYKLVVFVPPAETDALRRALSAAGACVIGHYSECSFEVHGRGTFRGDDSTNPTVGNRQVLEKIDEIRLEMVLPRVRLGEVIRTLYVAHSYEEPAFDLYPLHETVGHGSVGLGRVGDLDRAQSGRALIEKLRQRLDLAGATVVGTLEREFTSVSVAAGSVGAKSFCDPDSLIVTGELKHHDALDLLGRGLTAICLGHYASERPVLDVVRGHLDRDLPQVRVTIAAADQPPLRPLAALSTP